MCRFEEKCSIKQLDQSEQSQSNHPGIESAVSMVNWVHLLLCNSERVKDLSMEIDVDHHMEEKRDESQTSSMAKDKPKHSVLEIDQWWVMEQVELGVMGRLNSTIMDWYHYKEQYREIDEKFNLARSQQKGLKLRFQNCWLNSSLIVVIF